MTTSPKAPKAPVTISAPKIENAWANLVTISNAGEAQAIKACLSLAKEMGNSQLSIRDITKAIKQTGLESPFVKVSHVEGLPTMLQMQKVAGFSALPLSKQLSTAVASYKLLGAGNGEQLGSLEAIEKANAGARKAKVSAKAEAPKATKPKATQSDTLKSILAFVSALDFAGITEAEADIVTEIYTVIEAKTLQLA